MRNSPGRAAFTVAGLRGRVPLQVLGEDRTLEAEEGTFSDDFEGYGVHLYRIPVETFGREGGPEIASSGPGEVRIPAARPEPFAPAPEAVPAAAAPRPVPPGAHVRGADCRGCHPAEHERWAASRHAPNPRRTLLNPAHNAAELLSDRCLSCHSPLEAPSLKIGHFVRPLDREGPWSLVEENVPKWRGICCEVCHDPAGRAPKLLAFFDPRRGTPVPVRNPSELCLKSQVDRFSGVEQ